jgi:uncharacterized protein YuzE
MTGFFFQVFSPETECVKIDAGERGKVHGMFVSAKCDDNAQAQIIYIEITDGRVDTCVRIDDTDHNRNQILQFLGGHIDRMDFDEYVQDDVSLEKILDNVDAIMI